MIEDFKATYLCETPSFRYFLIKDHSENKTYENLSYMKLNLVDTPTPHSLSRYFLGCSHFIALIDSESDSKGRNVDHTGTGYSDLAPDSFS